MSLRLFSNNAVTTLAAPITSGAASLSVTSGGGALFPAPTGNKSFTATIQHVVSGVVTAFEIISCTARTTDTFTTIVRGQEGTTAAAWAAGDIVTLLPTADDMAQFAQFDDLQRQLGNYAPDVGSANAYVVNLDPIRPNPVVGMPIRFIAGHTNSTSCTFNPGPGVAPLVIAPGIPVPANTILAGGLYVATWDGSQYQLAYSVNLALYATVAELAAYVTNSALAAALSAYLTIAAAASTYLAKAGGTIAGVVNAPNPAVSNNTPQVATCAFVQAVNAQQIIRVGIVAQTIAGHQAHTFAIPFQTACTGLVTCVADSTGVEFFSVDSGTITKNGWTQYANNTCNVLYIAAGN